jgi:hypothetical protein
MLAPLCWAVLPEHAFLFTSVAVASHFNFHFSLNFGCSRDGGEFARFCFSSKRASLEWFQHMVWAYVRVNTSAAFVCIGAYMFLEFMSGTKASLSHHIFVRGDCRRLWVGVACWALSPFLKMAFVCEGCFHLAVFLCDCTHIAPHVWL